MDLGPSKLRRAALDEATAALDAAGIRWAALKGIDLAYRAYASPELREMSDVDVLVDEERVGDACAALRARGFEPLVTEAAHQVRLGWRVAPGVELVIPVEIHGALFEPPHPFRVTTKELLDRAMTTAGGTRVLAPADAWLHVALHFAWSDAGGGPAERTMRDLEMLARATGIGVAGVAEEARKWRAERVLAIVFGEVARSGRELGAIAASFAAASPGAPVARWLVRRRVGRGGGLTPRGEATITRAMLGPAGIALKIVLRGARRRARGDGYADGRRTTHDGLRNTDSENVDGGDTDTKPQTDSTRP